MFLIVINNFTVGNPLHIAIIKDAKQTINKM